MLLLFPSRRSLHLLTVFILNEQALNKYGDVILAYEMNGEELTRDHGYPLRAVVPGKPLCCLDSEND